VPLRHQLAQRLRAAVADGRLPAGTALPSSRALAAQLAVSRGVVSDAYEQLAAEGFLASRPRARPVVRRAPTTPRGASAPAGPAVRYDLVPGVPDLALFPRRAWQQAVRRAVASCSDAALDYDRTGRGTPALRTALAAYLARTRGLAADPERLVTTSGFRQGLDLACRLLAARGGRAIAVEDPSYDGQWETIRRHGLRVAPVPTDEDGIDVGALAATRADAVVVTPAHQFPTGVLLAPGRRAALRDWAHATGALILEDDYDAEYRDDRTAVGALQALAPEHTLHLGSASKILAPALRLGWVVAPRALAAELAAARRAADGGARALDEHALAHLLETGGVDRHLRRARAAYRERRAALAAAVAEHLPAARLAARDAGLHAVLELPPRTDADAAAAAAARLGVRVRSLGSYRLTAPRSAPALVLGYGRLPAPSLAAAVALLARALCHDTTGRGPVCPDSA